MVPGYSPPERPRTDDYDLENRPRSRGGSSSRGVWIALVLVVALVAAVVMLLSMIPEG
jgi:hypothetical protein